MKRTIPFEKINFARGYKAAASRIDKKLRRFESDGYIDNLPEAYIDHLASMDVEGRNRVYAGESE